MSDVGEYGRRTVNSQQLAGRMNLLLSLAGRDLGESLLGRVVQGSYTNGVGASAGTHDKGGAVDLSVSGWSDARRWQALTALRRRGLVAWYRAPLPGVWGPHIHGIDRGATDLSWAAAEQVSAFTRGRNGLANNGPDDGPKVDVPRFDYRAGLAEWERGEEPKEEPMGTEYADYKSVYNVTVPRGREVTLATVDARKFDGQALLFNAQFSFDTGLVPPGRARVRFVRVPKQDGTGEADFRPSRRKWRQVHNHTFMGGMKVDVRVTFAGAGSVKLNYLHFKAVRFG